MSTSLAQDSELGNPRNQVIPTLLFKHKMHVGRPPWMSLQKLQQLPYWPVVRNWVRHGHNRLEPKNSLLVTVHHAPPIRALPITMLHIVMTGAIRFPDINLHPFNRVSFYVLDCAENETWFALGIV